LAGINPARGEHIEAKLAELHTAGILTDDEFTGKKKQLLGL